MNEITYPPGCKDIQGDIPNDELIRRLKKIQQAYQNLEQTSEEKYKQLAIYLGSEIFTKHENEDVQLLVACCIADIFRVYAPESPYEDPDNLKSIFIFLAHQLKGLRDHANTSFKRYFYLLENLECVKTFQLCLELDDSQEVIAILFENVFKIISDKHTAKVKTLFFDLLHPLLNESDQLSPKVIEILFTRIIEPQKSNNKETYNLATSLIKKGGEHFEYFIQNYLNNVILIGKSESHVISEKMCLIIYELNQLRPSLLELALPQLEYKLKSSDLKERREYTKLLSKMFCEKDSKLATTVTQLWEAYLERFSDSNDEIRKICVLTISDFLLNHSELNDQIYDQINNRSLDTDESIRSELVQQILLTLKTDNAFITDSLINVIRDRTLDIKIRVRKLALQGLAAIYKKVHSKSSNKAIFSKVSWIPSKIMRIHFQESSEDKLVVERLLNSSIVPYSLSPSEKMIQLYLAYATFDEFSILSLMSIMRERILLHQSIKTIIDIIESNNDSKNEAKLNEHINIIAFHLLDVSKGQDLMKNLIKLFKENLNLKNHFKNLVDPQCSCNKSLELISLILANISTLNQTNQMMVRRLIERMSSIVIDEEAFDCLIRLVETKIFNYDKNNDLDYINDDGEKGLQLIGLILRIHTNRLVNTSLYEKIFSFLRSKKENITINVLKILSTHFTTIKDTLETINNQNLSKLKLFVKNGTPKQAKYSIRCINFNYSNSETILEELYKEIIKEISIKNEKTFLTLLVSLGHLAYYIPNLIGQNLKTYITQTLLKELIVGLNESDETSTHNKHDVTSSKLAGKWCDNEDDLPFETRAQIEAIKTTTRWCLGLKQDCSSLVITMRILVKMIQEQGGINKTAKVAKSEPEKARLRLVCGSQLLKLAQEGCFRQHLAADYFHTLARLIIDPVPAVRDAFIKKLHKALKGFKLPIQYLSIFILSGLDPNRDRKIRVKKLYIGLIKLIRDANKKKLQIMLNDEKTASDINELNDIKTKSQPENCLPYAISLLAHNTKIDSLKDEAIIKQIKDCLAFILDPLVDNPDGYQIAFIKKILNTIKMCDDAIAQTMVKNAPASDQLKYGANLVAINRRITTICEIAFFHICSKIVVPVGKEYPYEIRLNTGFFKPKGNLNETIGEENNDKSASKELEVTLSALHALDKSNEKNSQSKVGTSRKRKQQQQQQQQSKLYIDDENAENEESDNEGVDEESGSMTSGNVSLNDSNKRVYKTNNKQTSKLKTSINNSNSSASSFSSPKSNSKLNIKKEKDDDKFSTPPASKKKRLLTDKNELSDKAPTISLSSSTSSIDSLTKSPNLKIIKADSTKINDKNSEITITRIAKESDKAKNQTKISNLAVASNISDTEMNIESPELDKKSRKTAPTRVSARLTTKTDTDEVKKTAANGKKKTITNTRQNKAKKNEESDNESEQDDEDEDKAEDDDDEEKEITNSTSASTTKVVKDQKKKANDSPKKQEESPTSSVETAIELHCPSNWMTMNYYDIREAEINDKLRRIQDERNELIKMSDVQLSNQYDILKTLFLSNVQKARYRNQVIINEVQNIMKDIDIIDKCSKSDDKRFKILKDNYWSMVKSVYPVWLSDLEEYRRRQNAMAIKREAYDQYIEKSLGENIQKSKSKSVKIYEKSEHSEQTTARDAISTARNEQMQKSEYQEQSKKSESQSKKSRASRRKKVIIEDNEDVS